MRKISLILAVIMIAAPAWAASNVTVEANQVDTNEVAIQYVSDGNLPRAFGLDITVSDGSIIGIKDYHIGESNSVAQGYGIFPGTIQIDEGGNVTNYGSPVSPNSFPDTLDGLDTNGITIEVGSLYEDANYVPPLKGTLCVLIVSDECTVSILGNAARTGTQSPDGVGVVMEDPDEDPNVTFKDTEVIFQPACWSFDCFDRGDSSGDCYITSTDLMVLFNAFPPKPYDECADFSKDGYVTSTDLMIMFNHFPPKPGCDPNCVPASP